MGEKKVKVVFFSRKPRALGDFSVETYFKMLAEHMSSEFEVQNVLMPFESKGLFPRLFNAIYCFFHQGDVNHITGDIHYVASFLKKRKTILTVLDCGMLQQSSGIKHKILKLFWFTIPIKKVKHVTAISTATKNEVLRHVNCKSSKVSVIYVCVNEQFKAFSKKEKGSDEVIELLQIGTAPNKNIERLIPALKGLNVRLTIIGKVSDSIKESLEKNTVQHNIKDWKLTDEEMLQEYHQTDILTFVSTIEGFGMPIVEANRVGRIVVTSNISSMPEIAGDAAIFVDPLKVSSIRNGMEKAIETLKDSDALIEKGYVNADRFDVKQLAENYASIYRKIVGTKAQKHS